jgi:hypothetical protein
LIAHEELVCIEVGERLLEGMTVLELFVSAREAFL